MRAQWRGRGMPLWPFHGGGCGKSHNLRVAHSSGAFCVEGNQWWPCTVSSRDAEDTATELKLAKKRMKEMKSREQKRNPESVAAWMTFSRPKDPRRAQVQLSGSRRLQLEEAMRKSNVSKPALPRCSDQPHAGQSLARSASDVTLSTSAPRR